MTAQAWDSEGYDKNARFVTDLAAPVLELLAPKPGEHILDVGCGDGILTKRSPTLDAAVVGVDSSADFVAAARKLGLTVMQQSASNMDFGPSFDAVFDNAALHWMKDADVVIGRVARALLPKRRFVAEMGGHGCVRTLQSALIAELDRRGYDGQAANPWYFPTVEDYGERLAAAGFDVRYIALIPRPRRCRATSWDGSRLSVAASPPCCPSRIAPTISSACANASSRSCAIPRKVERRLRATAICGAPDALTHQSKGGRRCRRSSDSAPDACPPAVMDRYVRPMASSSRFWECSLG